MLAPPPASLNIETDEARQAEERAGRKARLVVAAGKLFDKLYAMVPDDAGVARVDEDRDGNIGVRTVNRSSSKEAKPVPKRMLSRSSSVPGQSSSVPSGRRSESPKARVATVARVPQAKAKRAGSRDERAVLDSSLDSSLERTRGRAPETGQSSKDNSLERARGGAPDTGQSSKDNSKDNSLERTRATQKKHKRKEDEEEGTEGHSYISCSSTSTMQQSILRGRELMRREKRKQETERLAAEAAQAEALAKKTALYERRKAYGAQFSLSVPATAVAQPADVARDASRTVSRAVSAGGAVRQPDDAHALKVSSCTVRTDTSGDDAGCSAASALVACAAVEADRKRDVDASVLAEHDSAGCVVSAVVGLDKDIHLPVTSAPTTSSCQPRSLRKSMPNASTTLLSGSPSPLAPQISGAYSRNVRAGGQHSACSPPGPPTAPSCSRMVSQPAPVSSQTRPHASPPVVAADTMGCQPSPQAPLTRRTSLHRLPSPQPSPLVTTRDVPLAVSTTDASRLVLQGSVPSVPLWDWTVYMPRRLPEHCEMKYVSAKLIAA